MNLIAYRPQNAFDISQEVRDWMNQYYSSPLQAPTSLWPRINVWEQENGFTLEAEVPGMKSEDIELEVLNNQLTIKGSVMKDANNEATQRNYRIREFEQAHFERSFHLGEEIDQEKISARTENGILHVTLPKKEKALPRRIEVSPGG